MLDSAQNMHTVRQPIFIRNNARLWAPQNTAALGRQHPKCINTAPYLPQLSRNTYTAKADASFYLDWDQILTIKIQGHPHPFTAAGVGI